LLGNRMPNSVAKRLLVWLLYYEIVVPIIPVRLCAAD